MRSEKAFILTPGVIGYPFLFILLIWLVFWFEVRFGFDLNYLGIRPRTLEGLRGILFAPFIHVDIRHLFNNTIPLFILSLALFYFYRPISWKVLILGFVFTGLLTWIIGRPANHIGASGIIYFLASFLFFQGIFSKYYRLIALSLAVVFIYGGLLWFVVPVKPGISWEGHLSGLLVGLFLAFLYKQKIVKPSKFDWEREDYSEEEDEFMKHFDENGNFIERKAGEDSSETEYNYIYKERKEE